MFHNSKVLKMDGKNKRFVRFQNSNSYSDGFSNSRYYGSSFEIESGAADLRSSSGGQMAGDGLSNFFRLKSSKIKIQDHESKKFNTIDPRGKAWQQWNSFFLASCLAALFIDPLFFYLPVLREDNVCAEIDNRLAIIVTVLRTVIDLFHWIHIAVLFRTGYIVSSTRDLGRGELVNDPVLIAKRYLRRDFIIDLIAVLPVPQIVIWAVIPRLHGTTADNTKNVLRIVILLQLIPRLYPLTQRAGKSTKMVTETAWRGAAYNLLLYMLISHFFGAFYYLLAVERKTTCWHDNLSGNSAKLLDCSASQYTNFKLNISNIQIQCNTTNFDYGIYQDALDNDIVAPTKFVDKYFYCLWFGLRNLSTLGQGLQTSSYDGEIIFSIVIVVVGLTLFARLLGNMQTYLQSMTVRVEEMRLKQRDMEQWMQHRRIDPDLRKRIRNYEQYKWLETRGVNEEELVRFLPKDLRRDIKRHLCLDLVKRVPLFASMDAQLIDAICERLQPTLFTSGTNIVQEGDPVSEMLFIIRGHLKSETTNGGRSGFLNVGKLEAGHFCGEELLTWALDPRSGANFPSSTRSVCAETEVEAFALKAEDLKFVATQFRRLHSKQVQHTFRHYSQQWRTWAACCIQTAWRRFKRRKLEQLRRKEEEGHMQALMKENRPVISASFGAALLVSRFAANAMRGVHRMRGLNAASHAAEESLSSLKLQKPSEPDFSAEEGD